MSSPLLRPQVPESLDMGLLQSRPIRNICCVGAGYVGKTRSHISHARKHSAKYKSHQDKHNFQLIYISA